MKNNIFNVVENLLKQNDKYIAEDGKLLKAVVYSDVMTMDSNLLDLLLKDEDVKEQFCKNINGTLVFDKQQFAWFLESKEFLPDSYTKYTNKIGLTSKGEFLAKTNDVVLDFPYKDCYLEGGQDRDDQKRKEIFYNEIIASDEVRRMLAPKVFTNAKRYTKDGVENNITFNEDDNLIIKGNNLIALSSLLKRYEGKVKCIYIDPPYNTGNDSFNYNDSFNHSTWLTFMKNRLELAKKLLREDGVIFVHLDDKETHYCKVLMDSIFGRDNFIASAPRITGAGAAANRADYVLRKPYDFILIYANNRLRLKFKKIDKGNRVYEYEDKYGKFTLGAFQATGSDSFKENRPNLYYPIYVLKDGTLSLDKVEESIEILPNKIKGKDGRWMWKKEKFQSDKDRFLYFDGKSIKRKIYFDENQNQTLLQNDKAFFDETGFRNAVGTKEINELLGENVFNNPKPENLLHKLIDLVTTKYDIILDFHLGSGTTCAVAHKMGRRYIGIEQMDYIEDITVERMKKVIEGEQGGISKSVDWQGGGSFVYCELLEDASSLINKIQSSTEENIIAVKEEIYRDERIIPYITTEELNNADAEFDSLSLDEKKQALISLVDKNKLYVNYSDMEDVEYHVSEKDKDFTKSFYQEV